MQVGLRLSGIEKFEGVRENIIFNTFVYFNPVNRLENRSGVSEFKSFNNGASKGILDALETMCVRPGKIVVGRVTYCSQVRNVKRPLLSAASISSRRLSD